MRAILQRISEQLRGLNERLSLPQKIAIGVLAALLVGVVVVLAYVGSQPEYRTLYADLDEEGSARVVAWLKDQKVPYRLTRGGRAVEVPEEQVPELRLAMASQGGPGGVTGYRLLDESEFFGMPEAVLQINKRRILEGELARSVQTLDEVKSARVHLATAPEALFVEEQQPTTASVVLQLRAGASLSTGQVKGVVNLIAGAVPKLDSDNVTVVDSNGKVLSRQHGDLVDGSSSLEYQRGLERALERKATEVLERMVGPGKAVVRVSAKLDFSKEHRTEEIYDPERTAIRSEENLNEVRDRGGAQVGGAAGAAAANPNVAQGVVRVGDASNSTREKSVTNYEINRVVKDIQLPTARVDRLSVAVIVDGTYSDQPKAGASGGEAAEDGSAGGYVPRSAEEMKTIRRLVARAVEFDDRRGDQLEVANVRFQQEEVASAEAAMSTTERRLLYEKAIKYGLLLLLALLLIFLVFRPLVRWLTRGPEAAEVVEGGALPPPEELALPGEEDVAQLDGREPTLLDQVKDIAGANPDLAASVVRYWLRPIEG